MANYFTSRSSAKFSSNGREVVLFAPWDAMSALPAFAATSVVQREAILGESWVRQRTREGASIKMTATVMMDFETRSAAEVWLAQLQEFVTINPVGLLTFATGYMADGTTPSLTRVYHASLIVTPMPITAETQLGGEVVWAGMSLEATLSGDGLSEVPTYATQAWVTDQIAALNKSLAGTYATKDDLANAAYTLPIASPTVLGGIKASDSITIDKDGTAHAAGGSTGVRQQVIQTIEVTGSYDVQPLNIPTGYRVAPGIMTAMSLFTNGTFAHIHFFGEDKQLGGCSHDGSNYYITSQYVYSGTNTCPDHIVFSPSGETSGTIVVCFDVEPIPTV